MTNDNTSYKVEKWWKFIELKSAEGSKEVQLRIFKTTWVRERGEYAKYSLPIVDGFNFRFDSLRDKFLFISLILNQKKTNVFKWE